MVKCAWWLQIVAVLYLPLLCFPSGGCDRFEESHTVCSVHLFPSSNLILKREKKHILLFFSGQKDIFIIFYLQVTWIFTPQSAIKSAFDLHTFLKQLI